MRKMTLQRWVVVVAGLALTGAIATAAAADEFTLKDGRKIVGTIVGYTENMFRVQTDFGYVLIRKDKVVSIRVESGAEKKGEEPAAGGKATGDHEPAPARPLGNGATVGGEDAAATATKPAPSPAARSARPPVSRPLSVPLPAHVNEREEGNDYINDTFGFAMYKPPGWKLFEERDKVPAIVAMSSQDEQTLLFVDRQVWSGEPDLNDDRIESNLRRSYQDYKKLSQSSDQVDGLPAIRRSFTGVIDGVEWHGVSVRMARGDTVFGIVGLTSAETYAFQESVFNKMIRSFHFLLALPAARAEHSGLEISK